MIKGFKNNWAESIASHKVGSFQEIPMAENIASLEIINRS